MSYVTSFICMYILLLVYLPNYYYFFDHALCFLLLFLSWNCVFVQYEMENHHYHNQEWKAKQNHWNSGFLAHENDVEKPNIEQCVLQPQCEFIRPLFHQFHILHSAKNPLYAFFHPNWFSKTYSNSIFSIWGLWGDMILLSCSILFCTSVWSFVVDLFGLAMYGQPTAELALIAPMQWLPQAMVSPFRCLRSPVRVAQQDGCGDTKTFFPFKTHS